MRDQLSEIAHAAMKRTAARAQAQGLDVWQELNRVGLLATEPRKQEIEVSALKNLLDRFQSMSADDLLRTISWHQNNSNPATPADLLHAVTVWMQNYIDYMTHD
jgi:hypothetical protein